MGPLWALKGVSPTPNVLMLLLTSFKTFKEDLPKVSHDSEDLDEMVVMMMLMMRAERRFRRRMFRTLLREGVYVPPDVLHHVPMELRGEFIAYVRHRWTPTVNMGRLYLRAARDVLHVF